MIGRPITKERWHSFWLLASGLTGLAGLFVLSFMTAVHLRFDGEWTSAQVQSVTAYLPLFLMIKSLVFLGFRVRRVWHAYVSFPELVRLMKATVVSAASLGLLLFLAPQLQGLPRSILVLDGCATAALAGGLLCGRRWLRERRERGPHSINKIPVLIVGVNQTGVALLRAIECATSPAYRPVGLISDEPNLQGHEIGGVRVVGRRSDVIQLALKHGAQSILVVSGELTGREVGTLVNDCQNYNIAVRLLPSVQQILHGNVDFRPREVAIEDLLGRDTVSLDLQGLQRWLKDRRIMVTGSCGSIGSEISKQLLQFSPSSLILVDRSETGQFFLEHELKSLDQSGCVEIVLADMNDPERLKRVFDEYRPEVVFHAAAYKHVPLMEQHPREAVRNIVGATKNLVDAAVAAEVESFVMISTDKAVNPTSVMGCCKRVAELYVQATARQLQQRFVTVRFGNVLGSAGSVIPVFRNQIAKGGPVTVTHPDMTRYFMTIPEASQLVIQAGALGKGGEIFVLDMGNPVRIMDLAEAMIRLSGLKVGEDIDIEISGLRPGEKLYEELYTDDETQCPTVHPKILTANSERMEMPIVKRHIERLLHIADEHPESIRLLLSQVVPRYRLPATERVERRAA